VGEKIKFVIVGGHLTRFIFLFCATVSYAAMNALVYHGSTDTTSGNFFMYLVSFVVYLVACGIACFTEVHGDCDTHQV
jgi:hypothetical protein